MIKKIILIFLYLLTLPLICFIILFLMIFQIHVFYLFTSRIGDFCLTTEYFIRRYNEFYSQKKILIISNKALSTNSFLYQEYISTLKNHHLIVIQNFILVRIFFFIQKILKYLNLEINIYKNVESGYRPNFNKFFKKSRPSLKFEKYTLDYKNLINYIGIDLNKYKICCLHIREDYYLKKIYSNNDWSFNNFRNANFNNYILTINELIKLNYYVFLIGYNKNNIQYQNLINPDKLINFNQNKFYSSKHEVLLVSNCHLFIGTNSGISHLPQVLNKAELLVNFTPIGEQPYGYNNLYIPKILIDKTTKKKLSLKEILLKKLHLENSLHSLNKRNYKYIENSEEDILDALKEFIMYSQAPNDYQPSLLQVKFIEILNNLNVINRNNNMISNAFLKKNKFLIND